MSDVHETREPRMTETSPAVPTETTTGRRVVYAPEFYGELVEWRDSDPATARRVVRLVEHAILTPGEGPGRPKPLRHAPGLWSRRITREHRLIYRVTDEELVFLGCRGHDAGVGSDGDF